MSGVELHGVQYDWPEMDMRFDLAVAPGQLVIVTGPSGSGKSTLLNLIAGFEPSRGGTITLDGKDCTLLPPSVRPVSMLFQEHNLFGHLNVETNVGFGIGARTGFDEMQRSAISEALKRVGLQGKEKRLPNELSGGERQRAAFARTLLQDRPILLLDEPFASLGPSQRAEMTALVSELQAERPRTILAVTHHPSQWREAADGFVFVESGKITAQGRMDTLDHPSVPEGVRAYLGQGRLGKATNPSPELGRIFD
jgi:thiamine transport system ATP-binding protein